MARALRREASTIDVHLLRPLDLENLRHGMAALGGGFPVDLVEAVAGHVLAELFKVAALPRGALRVDAELPRRRKSAATFFRSSKRFG